MPIQQQLQLLPIFPASLVAHDAPLTAVTSEPAPGPKDCEAAAEAAYSMMPMAEQTPQYIWERGRGGFVVFGAGVSLCKAIHVPVMNGL